MTPTFATASGIQFDFLLSQVRGTSGSLANGKVYFYSAGTTTPKTVYLNIGCTDNAANPYTLDANGTAHLYGNGTYRVVIKTSVGVTVYDRDNLKIEDLWTPLTDNSYSQIIRPKSIIGDSTGVIQGFQQIGSSAFTDNLTLYGNDFIIRGSDGKQWRAYPITGGLEFAPHGSSSGARITLYDNGAISIFADGGDNALEIQQKNAATAGQSAIRFLDVNGSEMGVVGFGNKRSPGDRWTNKMFLVGGNVYDNTSTPADITLTMDYLDQVLMGGPAGVPDAWDALRVYHDGKITLKPSNYAIAYAGGYNGLTMDNVGKITVSHLKADFFLSNDPIRLNRGEDGAGSIFLAGGNDDLAYDNTFANMRYGMGVGSGYMIIHSHNGAIGTKIADYNGSSLYTLAEFLADGSGRRGDMKVNGGIQAYTTTAKRTCNSSTRGTFWVVQSGAGVKDTVEVCAKDAGDAYAWRTIY